MREWLARVGHPFAWLLRGEADLLAPPIRYQILILYDAELRWSVRTQKAVLEPEERVQIVRGVIEVVNVLAAELGVTMEKQPQGES